MKEELVKHIVVASQVVFVTTVAYSTVKLLKFIDRKTEVKK